MSVRLEPRHIFVNYGVVLTAIVSFGFLWVPNLHNMVAPHATGKAYLLIGIVLASLLAAATATKRRVLAGLAAMLLAIAPWGPEYFLQILVFALGIWHLVQVARVTKAASGSDPDRSGFVVLARSALGKIGRIAASPPVPQPLSTVSRPAPRASKRYTPPAS